MADIDVVRKRPTSVWLWVIAAVVLVVVLVAWFAMRADRTPVGSPASELLRPQLTLTTTGYA